MIVGAYDFYIDRKRGSKTLICRLQFTSTDFVPVFFPYESSIYMIIFVYGR